MGKSSVYAPDATEDDAGGSGWDDGGCEGGGQKPARRGSKRWGKRKGRGEVERDARHGEEGEGSEEQSSSDASNVGVLLEMDGLDLCSALVILLW